jgi:uncharacterized protein (DUF362 family)
MADKTALRYALAHARFIDGGWGYVSGARPHPEPSSFALMALHGSSEGAAACTAAWSYLDNIEGADGLYRETRPEATWPTAIVLFARSACGQTVFPASVERLIAARGRRLPNRVGSDRVDIDTQLTGWPWAIGNFSWVEPTAWACLVLRRTGNGSHAAVAEGLRLLLDRALEAGGANYGNRRVLEQLTEPIPTPTALMLLALQGVEDQPRVNLAAEYLNRVALTGDEIEHLAWAAIAANARNDPTFEALLDRLRKSMPSNVTTMSPMAMSLAILALDEDRREVFRLRDAVRLSSSDSSSAASEPPKPSWFHRATSAARAAYVWGLGMARGLPDSPGVHIADAPDYDADLVGILRRQFESFRRFVPLSDRRVVLKPNLVEHRLDKVINTDWRLIAAVVEMCRLEGAAEVIVAEGPGHWRNVGYLLEQSQLGAALRRLDVSFVDLNHDEATPLLNLGRCTGLDHLYVAETILSADVVISLPKLKTHHWTGVTLSLKNMFGILPGICYGWPKNELHWRGIHESIVDITASCMPQIAIVDAIVGMEGDGPLNGTARTVGAVVMGVDLPAVDATCCRLMGIDPYRIPYLALAERKRLGRISEAMIAQLGVPIAAKSRTFALPLSMEQVRASVGFG